jgi:hypothetical protein
LCFLSAFNLSTPAVREIRTDKSCVNTGRSIMEGGGGAGIDTNIGGSNLMELGIIKWISPR